MPTCRIVMGDDPATPQLESLTVDPTPPSPHTHTVVFLHGRGDNVNSFSSALTRFTDSRGQTLAQAFPSFRWVFPQAPIRKCANAPRSVPQWFDVWDSRDFGAREELQAEGLKEVVPQIRRILGEEAARLGRWDRVVLAGISMGAATGVHTLFNLQVPEEAGGRLAAFIGFSARCPFASRSLEDIRQVLGLDDVPAHGDVLRKTPMLLEHSINDHLVHIDRGHGLRDLLESFGATVSWKEYPSGGHWLNSPAGTDDVVDFLNQVVANEVGCKRSRGCNFIKRTVLTIGACYENMVKGANGLKERENSH